MARRAKQAICKLYKKYLRRHWGFRPSNEEGLYIMHWVFMQDYKKYPFGRTVEAHRHGFCFQSWKVLRLNKDSSAQYMSDVQYYKMHPLNGVYTKWIDDKITLKYLCHGTELDRYFPRYYFQVDGNGNLLKLMDVPESAKEDNSVIILLQSVKELALKPMEGSMGAGFYKVTYSEGMYKVNGEEYTEESLMDFLNKLKNYIIMEYLHPHVEFGRYCPGTANTIRYQLGRIENEIYQLGQYIRFGTRASGFVENYHSGGVLCYLDQDGHFKGGNWLEQTRIENIPLARHPDTGEELEGNVPLWGEIKKAAYLFCRYFPQLSYCGFDFVVTSDNQVKILEVNKLSDMDCFQLDKPIWEKDAGVFFKYLEDRSGF